MPGRAAADLRSLEKDNVAASKLSQVIGNARPDDSGANDDHLRMARRRSRATCDRLLRWGHPAMSGIKGQGSLFS
jgi:hypothetical protein